MLNTELLAQIVPNFPIELNKILSMAPPPTYATFLMPLITTETVMISPTICDPPTPPRLYGTIADVVTFALVQPYEASGVLVAERGSESSNSTIVRQIENIVLHPTTDDVSSYLDTPKRKDDEPGPSNTPKRNKKKKIAYE